MKEKVKWPAITMIAVAISGLLLFVLMLAISPIFERWLQQNARDDSWEHYRMASNAWKVVQAVFVLGGTAFLVFAGVQMLRLRNWVVAVAASVMIMIPCFSYFCCVLGVPVGIWSLIVLFDKDVRAAFDQPTPPPL